MKTLRALSACLLGLSALFLASKGQAYTCIASTNFEDGTPFPTYSGAGQGTKVVTCTTSNNFKCTNDGPTDRSGHVTWTATINFYNTVNPNGNVIPQGFKTGGLLIDLPAGSSWSLSNVVVSTAGNVPAGSYTADATADTSEDKSGDEGSKVVDKPVSVS